jgi:transposase
MKPTTYGLDIAKRVFQMYWIEEETGEICNRRFSRAELVEFLCTRPAGRIVLEACGSAQFWARKLKRLGHEVVLLHAKFIRPFVQNNKTDSSDARALWTAAHQPDMRTVSVKTEDQQAMLGLHRIRAQLVKFRTAQVNGLRGLLYEFGITLKRGRQAALNEICERRAELEQTVPGLLWGAIEAQLARINGIDEELKIIEQRIRSWQKEQSSCQAIAEIPGIGLLTATTLVATLGHPRTFKSGRGFAAFLGLVPRQRGTGGKVRLGAISKRGDVYLRTLLIHGARSVLFNAKDKSAWAQALLVRRPTNVAAVALANKMARTAWAILAHERSYQRDYVSIRPA